MLHGRARTAVCWATERTQGSVLNPNDILAGSTDGNTVFDILQTKHSSPSAPTKEVLIDVSVLPEFEEVELTSAMYCVLFVRYKVLPVLEGVMQDTGRMYFCGMVLIVTA